MSEHSKDIPFSRHFFDKNNTASRAIYFRIYLSGCFLVVLTIFAVLSIYWGSLWSTPVRNIHGWVVVCKLFFSLLSSLMYLRILMGDRWDKRLYKD